MQYAGDEAASALLVRSAFAHPDVPRERAGFLIGDDNLGHDGDRRGTIHDTGMAGQTGACREVAVTAERILDGHPI